jgi:3-oxoacyl-[acyl-carrier protein] reductase
MDLGLKGKVALVTGAGGQKGFGKAIALTLAREGCDVIVGDIDLEGAEKTAAEVKALGRKSLAVKMDVTKVDEVNSVVKSALDIFKKIDILVNNAGATTSQVPLTEKPQAELDMDINLNIKGVMYCSKAVLPQMLSRKSGKIVNIASIAARKGAPNTSTYAAAKAGVVGFTQSLATEVAPSGIIVNSVSPGLGLSTNFAGGNHPAYFVEKAKHDIPLKRITEPQDIANVVTFLASDVSMDVVGQNISVDGGLSLT